MSEHRVNYLEYEGRVFNVKELRYTQNQKAVCNARMNVAAKLDDEWHPAWMDLTAWGEAAEVLAQCQHGDDIIIREGRLGASAYKKNGEVVTEVAINANKIERVGSFDTSRPAPKPATTDDDLPF